MADRIRFSVNITPIETLTDEDGQTHDIIASEVKKSLGGSGDSIALTDYSQTANLQGYKDATVNYRSASHSADGTILSSITPDFVFIKNTGFKYSDATTLGASTTDCVMVALNVPAFVSGVQDGYAVDVGTGRDFYIEIGWLRPGQAMVLPVGANSLSITQFGSNTNDLDRLNGYVNIVVRTFQSNGSAATSANAVEFLACT